MFAKLASLFSAPCWVQKRCPQCNALLFELHDKRFKKETVRVKCRRCKKVLQV